MDWIAGYKLVYIDDSNGLWKQLRIETTSALLLKPRVAACDEDSGCANVTGDDEICGQADENPMWLTFMRSVKHYSSWIVAVQEGVYQGGDFARDNATNLVHQFSSHVDMDSADVGNPMTIATGILVAWGAAISALGLYLVSLVLEVELLIWLLPMTTPRDYDLPRRRHDIAHQRSHKTLREFVNSWEIDLYAKPVWFENDAYNNEWYSDKDRSLPQILKNGDFVQGHTDDVVAEVAGNFGKNVNVGALAFAWAQENVFIIKLATDVKGTEPCDVDWDSTFEASQECIGEAAYVFHGAKTMNNNGMTTFSFGKPPSIDKLADYGLPNQRALMRATINSPELGGYLKNWTAPELLGNWQEVNATKVFNLPIWELEIPDSKNPNVDFLIFSAIGRCRSQQDTFGNDFPYDYEAGYYNF